MFPSEDRGCWGCVWVWAAGEGGGVGGGARLLEGGFGRWGVVGDGGLCCVCVGGGGCWGGVAWCGGEHFPKCIMHTFIIHPILGLRKIDGAWAEKAWMRNTDV